jgi:hypothetical protein
MSAPTPAIEFIDMVALGTEGAAEAAIVAEKEMYAKG